MGPLLSVASLLAAKSWTKGAHNESICWPSHPLSMHLLRTIVVRHILKQDNEVRNPALKVSLKESTLKTFYTDKPTREDKKLKSH